jgi:HKD family nuclease
MSKPTAPCRNCPDRELHCHGKCEKYKKFLDENIRDKEAYHKSLIWDKYHEVQAKKLKGKR